LFLVDFDAILSPTNDHIDGNEETLSSSLGHYMVMILAGSVLVGFFLSFISSQQRRKRLKQDYRLLSSSNRQNNGMALASDPISEESISDDSISDGSTLSV